jgi:hypothetical protein
MNARVSYGEIRALVTLPLQASSYELLAASFWRQASRLQAESQWTLKDLNEGL